MPRHGLRAVEALTQRAPPHRARTDAGLRFPPLRPPPPAGWQPPCPSATGSGRHCRSGWGAGHAVVSGGTRALHDGDATGHMDPRPHRPAITGTDQPTVWGRSPETARPDASSPMLDEPVIGFSHHQTESKSVPLTCFGALEGNDIPGGEIPPTCPISMSLTRGSGRPGTLQTGRRGRGPRKQKRARLAA